MERIFASPSRYVQGKGVLKDGLSHIKDLGKKVLLLTDETVWKIAGEDLFDNLKAADLDPVKKFLVEKLLQMKSIVSSLKPKANPLK